jgi:hypothetical protein
MKKFTFYNINSFPVKIKIQCPFVNVLLLRAMFIMVLASVVSTKSLLATNIYVDIEPDTVISEPGGFYNLDLNLDGIPDYKISRGLAGDFSTINVSCLNDSNYVGYYSLDGCYWATALSFNDSITWSSPWINIGVSIAGYGGITYCMSSGSFVGQFDKCIGFKMVVNGIVYFGWVRIEVGDVADWFRIKDYGCSTNPTVAGMGIGTGAGERFENTGGQHFRIYPNPADHFLTIERLTENLSPEVFIRIFRTTGEIEYSSEERIFKGKVIDVKNLDPGLYSIQIIQKHKIWTTTFLKL